MPIDPKDNINHVNAKRDETKSLKFGGWGTAAYMVHEVLPQGSQLQRIQKENAKYDPLP